MGWGAGIDAADARRRGVYAVLAKPYRMVDPRRVIAQVTGEVGRWTLRVGRGDMGSFLVQRVPSNAQGGMPADVSWPDYVLITAERRTRWIAFQQA